MNRGCVACPSLQQVKDCEIWFMAFDILYRRDRSVMNEPLSKRKQMLSLALKPPPSGGTLLSGRTGQQNGICGRIYVVGPGEGPELPGPIGGKNIKRALTTPV